MTGNSNADETATESCNAVQHKMFLTQLNELDVGDTAGLIDFEHRSGYGRIAIERTEEGESDIIKLQRQDSDADTGYTDIETITTVGRWFARGGSWEDLEATADLNEAEAEA
jgi:hypothetical protein